MLSVPHRPGRRFAARGAAVLLVTTAAVAALAVATPATAADSSTLPAGSVLTTGASLLSGNGTYRFTMQTDGNLVLYGPKGAMWASKTFTSSAKLTMQTDGNAVVRNAAGAAIWNTQTPGSGANKLVVQDNGDVVLLDSAGYTRWHTDTGSDPDPVSLGASVPANTALTPFRYLTSANKAVSARFADDGSFVVRTQDRVLWTAVAGAQPGQRFIFQSDGNVVLYGSTQALWTSSTRNATPATLTMQDDGNLVARSTTGAAVWSSQTQIPQSPGPNADRLLPGQQLGPGQSVKGGGYTLTQQTDGNLVVRGPAGAIWASNTPGWGTVTSSFQTDGNFVVRSPAGSALWYTGTRGGVAIVMQTDGNLVVRNAAGAALWNSFGAPKPPPTFAPVTAPPPTAVSRYLRNLDGSGADLVFMRSAGCSDARAVPNGKRYLTFLAFGAQSTHAKGGWGVNLTASTGLISNAAVVAAVKSYVDGYRGCMQPYSHLTVAIGTNNDGEDAGLGSTGGAVWATQVVNPVAAYANPGGRVTIAAANDIEPGFAGNATQAISWMQGYLANSSAPFVNTGSADGCPQTLGTTTTCNYGWTPKNLYDLTYGMMPTRALPLVQIYYSSMARQWANISLVGGLATGKRMTFAGPLTEVTACDQADSCFSMDATSAWNTLWNQLRADPRTAISDLQYTTDLRIDW